MSYVVKRRVASSLEAGARRLQALISELRAQRLFPYYVQVWLKHKGYWSTPTREHVEVLGYGPKDFAPDMLRRCRSCYDLRMSAKLALLFSEPVRIVYSYGSFADNLVLFNPALPDAMDVCGDDRGSFLRSRLGVDNVSMRSSPEHIRRWLSGGYPVNPFPGAFDRAVRAGAYRCPGCEQCPFERCQRRNSTALSRRIFMVDDVSEAASLRSLEEAG